MQEVVTKTTMCSQHNLQRDHQRDHQQHHRQVADSRDHREVADKDHREVADQEGLREEADQAVRERRLLAEVTSNHVNHHPLGVLILTRKTSLMAIELRTRLAKLKLSSTPQTSDSGWLS